MFLLNILKVKQLLCIFLATRQISNINIPMNNIFYALVYLSLKALLEQVSRCCLACAMFLENIAKECCKPTSLLLVDGPNFSWTPHQKE